MFYLKSLLLLLCLTPLHVSAEVKASNLIEEILDRAVKPIQVDFIAEGEQIVALTYAQNSFTVLRRETREAFIVEGFRPIAMYDLLQAETENNPGSFALAMSASLAPTFAKSEFEAFGKAADRCLGRESCTVRNLSANRSMWAPEDVLNLVTSAISNDTAIYESLTFSGTSLLDGSQLVRTVFFIQSADVIVGLIEPRDRLERSHGSTKNIVYNVLIFENSR